MSEILFRYERLEPTTWAYLSALIILALFFKFNRIWSVRNLDLLLLLLLSPGLLCVMYGLEQATGSPSAAVVEQVGYIWLFSVNAVLLLRALFDSAMVRRPLLEPNMNAAGLSFLATSLFLFLMANVITGTADESDLASVQRAEHLSHRQASAVEQSSLDTHGPGFPLLFSLPGIPTQRLLGDEAGRPLPAEEFSAGGGQQSFTTGQVITAKAAAIISQFMIVLGMGLIGAHHFQNVTLGIAAAMLYLLLPYTAMWTGSVTHSLPAALLVWAVACYRRPLLAGALLGLAFGTIYYPVFLLPLWMHFYWRKGLWRFLIGVGVAFLALVITQIFTSTDMAMFLARMQQMVGIRWPQSENLAGAWHYWYAVYRYPILAAFLGLSLIYMPILPAQKNLGTLLSCSAALMLGVQFWHAHSGGLALAWYLPLLLLMVFRPNLEDRIAVHVVRG